MSFLDIALPLAERGFRVFPLVSENKFPVKMSWGDHFDAATTDPAALKQWDKEVPRANVGISPDEIFCFLETDDEAALKEACKDLPPQVWDTARVSARENRCYYIFRQTMRTRKAGNMTKTRVKLDAQGKPVLDEKGKPIRIDNLFEFKQHRVLVVGPGSVHPKTKGPYAVEWMPTIPALPDVLLDRLCELAEKEKATSSRTMNDAVKGETDTLDRFLEYHGVATLGIGSIRASLGIGLSSALGSVTTRTPIKAHPLV